MTRRQSILVFDNHDSFTFNLAHYLLECGAQVEVVRSDSMTAGEALSTAADAFLISPGPGRPEQAGHSVELVEACAAVGKRLLGVCLGHQAIAFHFGARIVRGFQPVHGKSDLIAHDGTGLFASIPSPFHATRYHSLMVDPEALPEELIVNAKSADGAIQGLRHRSLPIHGIQFHPESATSQFGHELLRNFLEMEH